MGAKHKVLMVVLAILACTVIGCAKPESAAGLQNLIITRELKALQAEFDTLQFNYDSLKRASEGTKDANEKFNAQVNEMQRLRVENAALSGQMEVLTGQYNAVVSALTGKQADAVGALKQMNDQLNLAREQSKEINAQVKKVRDKKVSLLSDNLTDVEYKAFYKGLGLWWGTFND